MPVRADTSSGRPAGRTSPGPARPTVPGRKVCGPVTVQAPHLPVMVDRVAELLTDAPPGVVVDCTVGSGGHARAVLERAARRREPDPVLVGIDRDPQALRVARERLSGVPGTVHLVHARFDTLEEVLDRLGVGPVTGLLFDLGLSSMQVDEPGRGFSYRHEGPLDMRMNPEVGESAADLINRLDRHELVEILRTYGEERFASRIAAALVRQRPLATTGELAALVKQAIPAAARRAGPHPATRTFQALRIAVNDELTALAGALPAGVALLAPDGVCVTLAYHSLEDRIAKRTLSRAGSSCVCPPKLPVCGCAGEPLVELLTDGVERPSDDEVAANPRARAARLRAARRLATQRREAV